MNRVFLDKFGKKLNENLIKIPKNYTLVEGRIIFYDNANDGFFMYVVDKIITAQIRGDYPLEIVFLRKADSIDIGSDMYHAVMEQMEKQQSRW